MIQEGASDQNKGFEIFGAISKQNSGRGKPHPSNLEATGLSNGFNAAVKANPHPKAGASGMLAWDQQLFVPLFLN